jgi:hypothetical protein
VKVVVGPAEPPLQDPVKVDRRLVARDGYVTTDISAAVEARAERDLGGPIRRR